MPRFSLAILALCLLPGCLAAPGWQTFRAVAPPASLLNFDWRLQGDRAIAPLQAFDNGQQMWLQFAPGTPVPAIFAPESGSRPLSYRQDGPYVVLSRVWSRLLLRGGHLQAHVTKAASTASQQQPAAVAAPHALPAIGTPVPSEAPVGLQEDATATSTVARLPMAAGPSGAPLRQRPDATGTGSLAGDMTAASFAVAPPYAYYAGPEDGNMRLVLARWASHAGWTFRPEHWHAEFDIPLSGSARFEGDFKSAVRALLSATEMGSHPLQPCFYSNHVLRVVPHVQSCSGSLAAGAAS